MNKIVRGLPVLVGGGARRIIRIRRLGQLAGAQFSGKQQAAGAVPFSSP